MVELTGGPDGRVLGEGEITLDFTEPNRALYARLKFPARKIPAAGLCVMTLYCNGRFVDDQTPDDPHRRRGLGRVDRV